MGQPGVDQALFAEVGEVYAGTKPWWQAKRIWGLLLMAGAWTYNLGAVRWGWPEVRYDLGAVTTSIDGFVAALGFVVTWWGSVKASQPISLRRVAPGVSLGGRP